MIVVVGHSIIIYSSDWELYTSSNVVPFLDYLKKIINIFQMPLFFSLSGYLLSNSLKKDIRTFTFKKIKRLLVPYFTLSFLWMIPVKCLAGYKDYSFHNIFKIYWRDIILEHDTGNLWFLPCLFICLLIIFLVLKVFKHQDKMEIFLLGVFLLLSLYSYVGRISLVVNVFMYLFWVYFGYLLAKHKEMVSRLFGFRYLIGFVCVVTIGLSLLVNSRISIVAAIIGSLLLYSVVQNTKNKVCDFLSKYSFGIYLIHSPLVYLTYAYIPNVSPWIVVSVNFFLFGTISILIAMLLTNTRLKVLLGA